MSEADGGTQDTDSDLPEGLYGDILGESDTPEDLPPEKPEAEAKESAGDKPADTPPAPETTANDWEDRYRNLESKFGQQGREYGEKVKALEEKLAKIEQSQTPTDPFAGDPNLESLDQRQKDMLLRASSAVLEQRLRDVGLSLDELPQLKQAVQQQTEEHTRSQITSEIAELKKEFGDETFNRYIPQMQQIANAHPNLGPKEVFQLASFNDLRKGQSERAEALKAERKGRAASADFGNERPNKPDDGKLTQEALSKLSAKSHGKPSPRMAALLREARRELG